MSKTIGTFELSAIEQDALWIHNYCPKCARKILDINMNVDYAEFRCGYCDILFYCH